MIVERNIPESSDAGHKLKNRAVLVVAEYEDHEGVFIKITYDPLSAEELLSETVPSSYQVMYRLFQDGIKPLLDEEDEEDNGNAPSTETVQ